MSKKKVKTNSQTTTRVEKDQGMSESMISALLFSLGLFLVLMTMDSGILGYILIFIGHLFLIMSIESVRGNNKSFKAAYIAEIAGILLYLVMLVINAALSSTELQVYLMIRTLLSNLALVAVLFFMHRGIVRSTTEENRPKGYFLYGAVVMLIYYVMVYVTAFVHVGIISGVVLVGGIVGALFTIYVSYRGWKSIDGLSKEIKIRSGIPSGVIFGILGIILVVIIVAMCRNANTKLEEVYKPVTHSDTKEGSTQSIQNELQDHGVPKEIIKRLNKEELKRYENATDVTKMSVKEQEQAGNTSDSKQTGSEEDVNIYAVSLENEMTRVLVTYKGSEDGSDQWKRYREGMLIGVESSGGVEITNVYGRNSYMQDDQFVEGEYYTLEKNTSLEERMKDKAMTYTNGIEDLKSYDVGNCMQNILAVTGRCMDEDPKNIKKKGGYIAFDIPTQEFQNVNFKIYIKYLAQNQKYNYPYADMEEYLFKYTAKYAQTKFAALPKQTWTK